MADLQTRKELEDRYFENRERYLPNSMILLIKGEGVIDEFIGDTSAQAMGRAILEGHDGRKYDLNKNDSYIIMYKPPSKPNV